MRERVIRVRVNAEQTALLPGPRPGYDGLFRVELMSPLPAVQYCKHSIFVLL